MGPPQKKVPKHQICGCLTGGFWMSREWFGPAWSYIGPITQWDSSELSGKTAVQQVGKGMEWITAPRKINMQPKKMKVWFRWCSFSNRWFSASYSGTFVSCCGTQASLAAAVAHEVGGLQEVQGKTSRVCSLFFVGWNEVSSINCWVWYL